MADFGEYVPSTLKYIFPLVLSRIPIQTKNSKLNNFNIEISPYSGLDRLDYTIPMDSDSVCIKSIPATFFRAKILSN